MLRFGQLPLAAQRLECSGQALLQGFEHGRAAIRETEQEGPPKRIALPRIALPMPAGQPAARIASPKETHILANLAGGCKSGRCRGVEYVADARDPLPIKLVNRLLYLLPSSLYELEISKVTIQFI